MKAVPKSRFYFIKRDRVDVPLRRMGLHLSHMAGKYSVMDGKKEVFHAFDIRDIVKWIGDQPKKDG